MYFAPLSTIHRAMLRPKPPVPSAITYDAFELKYQVGLVLGTVYIM
jgi:hypothetical protein